MAAVDRLEGADQLDGGVGGFGDGAGGIQFGGGEVAVGADEVLVVASETGDGFDGRLRFGEARAGRARHGERGDVERVDGGAGALRIEPVGEDAVEDLRGQELDGSAVLEERHGDILGVGQGGAAVAIVGEAEMESADDVVFAALSIDGESAAVGPVEGRGLGVLG